MARAYIVPEKAVDTSIKKIFDVEKIRKDFPILSTEVYGKPLVYLDNAATTQKPQCLLDTIEQYYKGINSNIHRGVHFLSEKATTNYEESRVKIRDFLNAKSTNEIIFVRGTTEAINLVASSYGNKNIKEGDEIILSMLEHHSNIVPWQLLCERTGAKIKVIPINNKGELIIEEYEKLITDRTRFVSVVHISNSLGTINPVKKIVRIAHERNIPVLLDGAQAAPHIKIDIQDIGCDFYAISGHKVFGPTGVGVLYGKENLLDSMPPYQGGGDMIETVTFEKTTYAELPHKFEAGTPNIAGAIAFGSVLNYVNKIGFDNILKHENDLMEYANEILDSIDDLRIIGTAKEKSSVISFLLGDIHPYDTGTILDRLGIAVRTGIHCTQPVMDRFGIPGTVRASFAFYNTKYDIDMLVRGIKKVIDMFS
ncbi:MAG: cysteine desulfurase [Ignavibacteria bacterium]|nr:cysteine desulfurase [Ignavibacteria bacterium]